MFLVVAFNMTGAIGAILTYPSGKEPKRFGKGRKNFEDNRLPINVGGDISNMSAPRCKLNNTLHKASQ